MSEGKSWGGVVFVCVMVVVAAGCAWRSSSNSTNGARGSSASQSAATAAAGTTGAGNSAIESALERQTGSSNYTISCSEKLTADQINRVFLAAGVSFTMAAVGPRDESFYLAAVGGGLRSPAGGASGVVATGSQNLVIVRPSTGRVYAIVPLHGGSLPCPFPMTTPVPGTYGAMGAE